MRQLFIRSTAVALAALTGSTVMAPTSAQAAQTGSDIRIIATEFKYEPREVHVKAGAPVTVVLDNSQAATEHGMAVPALKFRVDARAGQVARKTFVFDKPGTFPIVCDLPGHTEAGMTGTLVVQK